LRDPAVPRVQEHYTFDYRCRRNSDDIAQVAMFKSAVQRGPPVCCNGVADIHRAKLARHTRPHAHAHTHTLTHTPMYTKHSHTHAHFHQTRVNTDTHSPTYVLTNALAQTGKPLSRHQSAVAEFNFKCPTHTHSHMHTCPYDTRTRKRRRARRWGSTSRQWPPRRRA
jgi:hypothetical protein